MLTETDRLSAIRGAFPPEGLFAEKDWLLSPEPFPIEPALAKDLERLGHQLFVFQRACNQLYHQSVKGKQPGWVMRYLDAGKPPELVDFSRSKQFRDELPVVIRPESVLTENGCSVRRSYGEHDGMLQGFRSVLPGVGTSFSRKNRRRIDRR